jgi:hypothetical protein
MDWVYEKVGLLLIGKYAIKLYIITLDKNVAFYEF